MAEEQTKSPGLWSKLAVVLAPVFLLLFSGALLVLCGIKPYEKLTTYLNIAFMDTQRITDPNAGLIIKQNEISTDSVAKEDTSETGTIVYPDFGEQYAVLKCKAISLNVPVYWGSNATLLSQGACQSSSSKAVGDGGNTVIDAHVNTFFADLNQLKPGDIIEVYATYGIFTYTVREQVNFEKTDKTYLQPTETDQLTLYTCVSNVLGSSTERIGFLCDLTDKQFYPETTATESEDAAR